jgi:hypothetical protein
MTLSKTSLIAAFVCAAAACADSSAPTSIAVRATLERPQVRIGDAVRVPVEIENTGAKAVRINGGNTIAFLEVRNSSGTIVFFGRSGIFTLSSTTTTLDVGERASDAPVWSGELIGPDSFTPQPGRYRIRAAVAVGSNAKYILSDPLDVTLIQ